MRIRLAACTGLALAVLVAGCGTSGASPATSGSPRAGAARLAKRKPNAKNVSPSPTTTTTSRGPPPPVPVSNSNRCRGRSSVTGDVDGDGTPDRVSLVGRGSNPDACHYALVAHTGSGTRRVTLHSQPAGEAPRLDGLADIDRQPGLEIVVDTWQGASTAFAGVFTMRSGQLVRMGIEGASAFDGAGPTFPYAGSVTHEDGVDCSGGAGSGVVVASGAGDSYPRPWNVTRKYYRVQSTDFVLEPSRTQHTTVPAGGHGNRLSERFPEFSDARPFPGCTKAVPRAPRG